MHTSLSPLSRCCNQSTYLVPPPGVPSLDNGGLGRGFPLLPHERAGLGGDGGHIRRLVQIVRGACETGVIWVLAGVGCLGYLRSRAVLRSSAFASCWEERLSVVVIVQVRGAGGGVGQLLGLVAISQLLAFEHVGVNLRGVAGVEQVCGPSLHPPPGPGR